jgi:regulatory protein
MTQKKIPKKPRKLSKSYLENAALHYMGRYACTEAQLAAVLKRKIMRSAMFHDQNAEDFMPIVAELVTRYARVGLLDDAGFARNKTDSLRRSGKSTRVIGQKLRLKGVPDDLIRAALSSETASGDEEKTADDIAADIFARKKHLGPYRKKAVSDARKADMNDIAKMARAGFDLDTIRRTLNNKNGLSDLSD